MPEQTALPAVRVSGAACKPFVAWRAVLPGPLICFRWRAEIRALQGRTNNLLCCARASIGAWQSAALRQDHAEKSGPAAVGFLVNGMQRFAADGQSERARVSAVCQGVRLWRLQLVQARNMAIA